MGSFDQTIIDALMSVGVSRERAQSVAEILERRIDERFSLHAQVLATKRDIADLELKLVREMTANNQRLADQLSRFDERLSGTGIQIAEVKSDMIKWVFGALIAQSAMLLGAAKLMF